MKLSLKKEKIINTAFKVWGKNLFRMTSLSILTDKLNITKPALYRHFKNKKEIMDTMKKIVNIKILYISNLFINESKNLNSNEALYKYIEIFFSFFAKNIYIFYFYIIYVLKEPDNIDPKIIYLTKKINNIYLNKILKVGYENESLKNGFCERYVFSTGIFVLFNLNKNNKKIKPFKESEIIKIISKIYNISVKGFGNISNISNIDYQNIEKNVKINNKFLKRDKYFDSIASVVAKEGMWNTTISKISKELKMSKSSLYFYFKNKKEMLTNMVIEEIKRKKSIIDENLLNYKIFEEKLYCYISSITSYLFKDTRILKVYDWLHFQKINYKKINTAIESTSILSKIIQDGLLLNKIVKNDETTNFISSFLNMQIVKEIYCHEIIKCRFNINEMRFIYNYFLKGIFVKLEEL